MGNTEEQTQAQTTERSSRNVGIWDLARKDADRESVFLRQSLEIPRLTMSRSHALGCKKIPSGPTRGSVLCANLGSEKPAGRAKGKKRTERWRHRPRK